MIVIVSKNKEKMIINPDVIYISKTFNDYSNEIKYCEIIACVGEIAHKMAYYKSFEDANIAFLKLQNAIINKKTKYEFEGENI